MNKEEIINKLMDYLYEDMSLQDKTHFELWLKENPEWQKELDEMRMTRQLFSSNPSLKAPSIYGTFHPKPSSNPWIKPILAAAASIALLLIIGAWSKPNLTYSSGVFTLSFRNSSVPPVPNIQESLQTPNRNPVITTDYQESIQGKVEDAESRLMEIIQQNNQQLSRQLNKQIKINTNPSYSKYFVTLEDFQSFMLQERNKWRSEQEHQIEQIIQYIDLNNQQNKELIRNSFIELSQLLPTSIQDNNSSKLK